MDEQLAAHAGGMKERRKIVQTGIEKLHKVKTQQTNTVTKVSLSKPCESSGESITSSRHEIGTSKIA